MRDFPMFNEHWTRHSIIRWGMKEEREQYTKAEQVQITRRLLAAAERFGIDWHPPTDEP